MNNGWDWLAKLPWWGKAAIAFLAGTAVLGALQNQGVIPRPAPVAAPAPPATPPGRNLAELVDDIDQVSIEGRAMTVRARLGENALGDDWMLSGAARTVKDVGKALRTAAEAGKADTVEIRFWTDGVDRLGARLDLPLFDLRFPARDLEQAQFENLGFGPTLNLATRAEIRSPAGARIIAAWCAKPDNAQSGAAFCLLALA